MEVAIDEIVHRGIKIQTHGRRWRWRARMGRQLVVRSFETPDAARAALDEFLDSRRDSPSRRGAVRSDQPCVLDLCLEWLRFRTPSLAPATVQQYGIHIRVHIGPGIGPMSTSEVRPLDLDAFYRSLRWKSAKESHNILRQSFDWGLRNGLIERESNPCSVVRPSRRSSVDHDGYFDSDQRLRPVEEKDVPTRSEVEKLLIDAEALNARSWWLYLKFASTTGARPGEICALRTKDITPDALTVRIEWSADRVSGRLKRPKTPSGIRTLWLPPKFFEQVGPFLPPDPQAFLYPSNTQPGAVSPLPCWNSRGVKRRLDAALARTGIRHITPHAFRHFVATQLLDQGWPPLQVARFLGHANDSLVRTLYGNHIVDETQRLIGEAAAGLV